NACKSPPIASSASERVIRSANACLTLPPSRFVGEFECGIGKTPVRVSILCTFPAGSSRNVGNWLNDVLVSSKLDDRQQSEWVVMDFQPVTDQRACFPFGLAETQQDRLSETEQPCSRIFVNDIDVAACGGRSV